jgi:hypothetical protein
VSSTNTRRSHDTYGISGTWPGGRHGPYAEWTRKIGGKTVTRRLTPEQLAAWQPLFDNAKKLRALLAELQELTLAIIEASERPPP